MTILLRCGCCPGHSRCEKGQRLYEEWQRAKEYGLRGENAMRERYKAHVDSGYAALAYERRKEGQAP